jgi:hypothetical protein
MVEYLDPEIANEGEAATDWHPGQGPAPIPDMAKLLGNHPHFGRYFAPHRMIPFPAWIYHATEPERVVKTAKEAREYGVSYDTEENHYVCAGDWKIRPVVKKKPDPSAGGKNLMSSDRPQNGGASLEIMAQILQQMQKGQPAHPALNDAVKADPDYAAFVEFKKWKEAQAPKEDVSYSIVLEPSVEKDILLDLAREKNIKVDKRWGPDKIKAALDEAGEV